MNKSVEEGYLSIIEDNVNVSKTNQSIEFFILLAGIAFIIFCIYLLSGIFSEFCINHMSNETQFKIEKILSSDNIEGLNNPSEKIKFLETIKPKIISLDKNLQNKSEFKLYEIDRDYANAFIMPDGKIYFTDELLEKVDNEETLTFILAHELGHYSHRDHLKSIGRELISSSILSLITFGKYSVQSLVDGFSEFTSIKHSQKQEEQADIYANHVLYVLFGRNTGAQDFFEILEKEEKLPEFIYYFSSHPSSKSRKNLILNYR